MAPTGFFNAPATKAITGLSIFSFSFFFYLGKKSTVELLKPSLELNPLKLLSLSSLFSGGVHLARVFTFVSPTALILGVILLYNLREVEQHIGSLRYVQYLVSTSVVSFTLRVVVSKAVQTVSTSGQLFMDDTSSGSIGFIFALFVAYFAMIPRVNNMKVMGVQVSEKTLHYALGAQLLASQGLNTLFVALSGVISGLLCLSGTVPYHRIPIPHSLQRFGSTFLLPILQSADPNQAPVRLGEARDGQHREPRGGERIGEQHQGQRSPSMSLMRDSFLPQARQRTVPQPPPRLAEPSEDVIQNLVAMGFDRPSVIAALRQTSNDPNRAADTLLG